MHSWEVAFWEKAFGKVPNIDEGGGIGNTKWQGEKDIGIKKKNKVGIILVNRVYELKHI